MKIRELLRAPRRRSLAAGALSLAIIAVPSIAATSVGAVPTSTNTYYVGTTQDDAGSAMATTCAQHTNKTCSLRDAIVTANADGVGSVDKILFTSLPTYSTVTLNPSNGPLIISDLGTLSITGSGPDDTYVSGVHATQVVRTSGANVTISNLTIENGFSSSTGAGIASTGTLTLSNVDVRGNVTPGNSSYNGGGIYSDGPLTIRGSDIFNNTSSDCGGGLATAGSFSMSIDRTTFDHNSSDCGGGIYNSSSTELTITNSTISNNFVRDYDDGGGIEQHGLLNLTNDTLANNTSTEYGGGLANEQCGTSNLLNVTVFDNNALQAGGGIYNNSACGRLYVEGALLQGNVVYNNIANQCFGYGPVTSEGFNVVAPDIEGTCNFHAAGDKVNAIGAPSGSLKNNGGPTATVALTAGSPALLLEPRADCPPADQRGVARISNCDAGAFELPPSTSTLTCTTLSGKSTSTITVSGCSPANAKAKTATAPGAFLTSGGTLTWHPSAKATTVALSATSPGRGACSAGKTEWILTGAVTSSTSSNAHFFDKVSATVCKTNATGAVSLLAGTKLKL